MSEASNTSLSAIQPLPPAATSALLVGRSSMTSMGACERGSECAEGACLGVCPFPDQSLAAAEAHQGGRHRVKVHAGGPGDDSSAMVAAPVSSPSAVVGRSRPSSLDCLQPSTPGTPSQPGPCAVDEKGGGCGGGEDKGNRGEKDGVGQAASGAGGHSSIPAIPTAPMGTEKQSPPIPDPSHPPKLSPPYSPLPQLTHALVAPGQSDEGETEPTSAAQAWQWHEVHAVPFPDTATGEVQVLVMMTDVTARCQLELRLMQLTEAQLYMLEQLFPRHVLELIAHSGLGGPGAMTAEIPDVAELHELVTVMFGGCGAVWWVCQGKVAVAMGVGGPGVCEVDEGEAQGLGKCTHRTTNVAP